MNYSKQRMNAKKKYRNQEMNGTNQRTEIFQTRNK